MSPEAMEQDNFFHPNKGFENLLFSLLKIIMILDTEIIVILGLFLEIDLFLGYGSGISLAMVCFLISLFGAVGFLMLELSMPYFEWNPRTLIVSISISYLACFFGFLIGMSIIVSYFIMTYGVISTKELVVIGAVIVVVTLYTIFFVRKYIKS